MHFNLLKMACVKVYKLLQMNEILRVREREERWYKMLLAHVSSESC